MAPTILRPPLVRFGVYTFNAQTLELRRRGNLVHLRPQPAKVLALLLSRPGELVTREQLQQGIWGKDTFIDFEQGLNFCVKQIRAVLNDDAEAPKFLETVPRRGYRFIASAEGEDSRAARPAPVKLARPAPTRRLAASALAGRRQVLRPAVLVAAMLLLVPPALWIGKAGLLGGPRHIRSIVVLPLTNLSGDASQEYFVDGMTDEVITDLAQIRDLQVISRTSAMKYKGSHQSAPEIGRDLNVDALVEGTVEAVDNRVRIRTQLIEARTDRHLWARMYDRDLHDLLRVQSEVARDIAEQVDKRVRPERNPW